MSYARNNQNHAKWIWIIYWAKHFSKIYQAINPYLMNSLPQWLKNLPWRRMEALALSVYMPKVSTIILPYIKLRSYALLSINPNVILIVKNSGKLWNNFFVKKQTVFSQGWSLKTVCSLDDMIKNCVSLQTLGPAFGYPHTKCQIITKDIFL